MTSTNFTALLSKKEEQYHFMEVDTGLEYYRYQGNSSSPVQLFTGKTRQNALCLFYCQNGVGFLRDQKGVQVELKKDVLLLSPHDSNLYLADHQDLDMGIFILNFERFDEAMRNCNVQCRQEWKDYQKQIFSSQSIVTEKITPEVDTLAKKILANPVENYLDLMEIKYQSLKLVHEVICHYLQRERNCPAVYVNNRKSVLEAKVMLEKNLQNPLTVKELAKVTGLSEYHLQQGFKWATGKTVYEYLKQCRFQKATDLLLNSNLSIMEVAMEVGYDNPSKFSQMFKQFTNVTPLVYRKQNGFC